MYPETLSERTENLGFVVHLASPIRRLTLVEHLIVAVMIFVTLVVLLHITIIVSLGLTTITMVMLVGLEHLVIRLNRWRIRRRQR